MIPAECIACEGHGRASRGAHLSFISVDCEACDGTGVEQLTEDEADERACAGMTPAQNLAAYEAEQNLAALDTLAEQIRNQEIAA